MEAKKDKRGRKPVKDKKRALRIYILESEIKQLGGEKRAIQKLYGFVEREINLNNIKV
jgi:hypothetical protein